MSARRNQYQRRQANRYWNLMLVISFFLTIILFFLAYLLLRNAFIEAMYQEVFASSNSRTLEQVQAARFDAYILPAMTAFTVIWMLLTIVLSFLFRRRRAMFSFGDTSPIIADIETGRPPDGFEKQVAWLITQQTGYRTKVTGGAGDKGVDVKVYDANRQLIGVVQCKRFHPNRALAPAYVQQMVGVRQTFNVNIVYLATTAYFTDETRRLAKQLNVRLIDGQDLKHISKKVTVPVL